MQLGRTIVGVVEKPIVVVKEIPRDVQKIVEKRVEVPAEIPDSYKVAARFQEQFYNAGLVEKNDILKGIASVRVLVNIGDLLSSGISISELKDSIELSLRKNGIKIDDSSSFMLEFDVWGAWDQSKSWCTYSGTLGLMRNIPVLSGGEFKKSLVILWWPQDYIGHVEKEDFVNKITSTTDKLVIAFSNAYLAANGK